MKLDIDQLAYCGLYCLECSFRAASETGEMRHLQGVPEKYARLAARPLADLACPGCKGDNVCGDCAIKDCAQEKGIAVCAECGEFPCERVEAFGNDGVPHHAGALRALREIREKGLRAWFAGVEPGLGCPGCGQRQSWYFRCGCR